MSTWTKVTAVLAEAPPDWSIFHNVFEEHGLLGSIQTDVPPTISAYLAPGDEPNLPGLKAALVSQGAESVEEELVHEEDWAESWKRFFVPRRVGERFIVRPTWEEYDAEPGDRVIVLDPGQAFGTGEHPTTQMCLEYIERHAQAGMDVLDVGCGSGILSIASAMLGARVVATDIDPLSVEVSRQNFDRNGVQVTAVVGPGFDQVEPGKTFDLVLSNIISAALINLAPLAAQGVRQGGIWIVSGIIQDNWDTVREKAESVGFQVEAHRQEGDWVAAVLRRR
ncbi:MAG: 50S ribosomal protein L11 methyltransferase [Fimbriimonadaceae bacterium]|nr:50S ribosomal protein L11 methyltransferase [Fimbriimonadaceae bacterium]QYK55449.1 MAG: 50S ribosomal protein L11 methyltransferase [Fimbriimonadaceae bacterium]